MLVSIACIFFAGTFVRVYLQQTEASFAYRDVAHGNHSGTLCTEPYLAIVARNFY